MSTVYDRVGTGYNTTRSADPYITGRILSLLKPESAGLYLDIGCGTGNYLAALAGAGFSFYGVDPSETMLAEARVKAPEVVIIKASAEQLPLSTCLFSGAIAMFTMHHWQDLQKGLSEVNRVLKPGARLVCLSFTPEQLRGYWLHYYFPKMIERSMKTIPPLDAMQRILNESVFELTTIEKYWVRDDLQDHFLYSNKNRPEEYLKPEVRNGASSFTVFSDPEELATGLAELERDIKTGRINDIMKDYQNDEGDYLFLVATKAQTILY